MKLTNLPIYPIPTKSKLVGVICDKLAIRYEFYIPVTGEASNLAITCLPLLNAFNIVIKLEL